MRENELREAEITRSDWEMLDTFLKSRIGKRYLAEMRRIQATATKASMLGKTPESNNVYMESRGKYAAVEQLRRFFTTVRDENESAIKVMQSYASKDKA